MINAERPGFEAGKDAMDPGQHHMSGHGADDMGVMMRGRQSRVSRPAIGSRGGGWRYIGLDEGVQTVGREIVDCREADPTRPPADDLDGADNKQLAGMAASRRTGDGGVLGAMIDRGLIDFHEAGQGVALGRDHGAAELGGQQPGALIGAEAELPPQLKGRDAVGMGGHQVSRPEPHDQRQLGAVHDGSGLDRGLAAAAAAFVSPTLGLEAPGAIVAAAGTAKAIGPADGGKIGGAGSVVRKATLEGDQRAGIVRHGMTSESTCSLFVLTMPEPQRHQHIVAPDAQG